MPLKKTRNNLILGILLFLIVIALIVFTILPRAKNNNDKKEFYQLRSQTTDCRVLLDKIKHYEFSSHKDNVSLLETKYKCSLDSKRYDDALAYLEEIELIYKSNNDVFKSLDIDESKAYVKQLKDQPVSQVAPKQEGNVQGGP